MNRYVSLATFGLLTATAFAASALAADNAAPSAWTTATVVAPADSPKGYLEFQNRCAVCHGKGLAKPGTRALAVKYNGKLPALLEERKDLQPETIQLAVRKGLYVMPFFRKTELSDAELGAIVSYLTRNKP